MQFTSLATYTLTTQKDNRFRAGDHFIYVYEAANKIEFDYDNGDSLFVRYEKGKGLVKGFINNQEINSKAIPSWEVPAFLAQHNIDLISIAAQVPFLHKILTQ